MFNDEISVPAGTKIPIEVGKLIDVISPVRIFTTLGEIIARHQLSKLHYFTFKVMLSSNSNLQFNQNMTPGDFQVDFGNSIKKKKKRVQHSKQNSENLIKIRQKLWKFNLMKHYDKYDN